ncbi:hypothetical protein KAR34_04700 [bacterium]|nr:hypothetical protein [bacterium]
MKKKTFDCVQMKYDIQQKLNKKFPAKSHQEYFEKLITAAHQSKLYQEMKLKSTNNIST